jgi:DNA-binding beta-propeller fold protein YncE
VPSFGAANFSQLALYPSDSPDRFSRSTAISKDGMTIAQGAWNDDEYIGSVTVYTRVNSEWVQQGPKLQGTGYVGQPWQGNFVALSDDGSTLALTGSVDGTESQGALWIFTRSTENLTWSQQGDKLSGELPGERLGFNGVALSGDGDTIVANGGSDIGMLRIFQRQGENWSQIGDGFPGSSSAGQNLAVSQDGSTIVVGNATNYNNNGSISVWVQSGWTYALQRSCWVKTSVLELS